MEREKTDALPLPLTVPQAWNEQQTSYLSGNGNLEKEAIILTATNTSTKNVALLLIPSEHFISSKNLYQQFHQIYKGTEFDAIMDGTILGYCRHFARNGLVREQVVIDDSAQRMIGFSLTDAGERLGRPAAALALHFEFNHKLSLLSVFGSASNAQEAQHRASYNRAKILRYLIAKGGRVRACEVAKELNIDDAVVSRTLLAFGNGGVIERATGRKSTFVTINDPERTIVSQHLDLIAGLVEENESVLNYLKEEIIPEVTSRLLDYARESSSLYYTYSNSHKMSEHREKMAMMLRSIAKSPLGRTVSELSQQLNLSSSAIYRDLATYVNMGLIKTLTIKGLNHYVLSSERALRSGLTGRRSYWKNVLSDME